MKMLQPHTILALVHNFYCALNRVLEQNNYSLTFKIYYLPFVFHNLYQLETESPLSGFVFPNLP